MAISLGSASKKPALEGQRKSTGDRRAGQRGWEYDAMQIFLDPSCMRFNENANAAMCTVARLCLDGDVHVLAERDQQAHQALAGEVCESPVEQRRHFRLVDAHVPPLRPELNAVA